MVNLTEDRREESFCFDYGIQQKILFSVINIPLSVTAFVGNILTLVALKKVISLHPPSKLLLGCLASTDLCKGLIAQPLFVATLLDSRLSRRCLFLKVISNTTGTIFGLVSLYTLTAISIDRLLALLLGLRYKQVVTLEKVRVLVAILWLWSVTVISLTFLFDRSVTIVIISLLFLVCVVTTSFCYSKIYWTLRHHQAQVHEHVHQGQPNGEGISLHIARYKKTVSSALWIQMTLLACYCPHIITLAVISITGTQSPSLNLAWALSVSLVFFNSTLNPFLYCWKIREVRQAVKATSRNLCCFSS